jgi:hypothetical protein
MLSALCHVSAQQPLLARPTLKSGRFSCLGSSSTTTPIFQTGLSACSHASAALMEPRTCFSSRTTTLVRRCGCVLPPVRLLVGAVLLWSLTRATLPLPSPPLVCPVTPESWHRVLKYDTDGLTDAGTGGARGRLTVSDVLGVILAAHCKSQYESSQALLSTDLEGLARLWAREKRPLAHAFVEFAQCEGLGDYLVNILQQHFWRESVVVAGAGAGARGRKGRQPLAGAGAGAGAPDSGVGKVRRLSFVGQAPPQLSDHAFRKALLAISKLRDDGGGTVTDAALETRAQSLLGTVKGLSGRDFHVRVTTTNALVPRPQHKDHTVTVARGSVNCTCWHFVGQHIICCHIFKVIKHVLEEVASTDSESESPDTDLLLGHVMSAFIGDTEWFVCREPLPVAA